MTSDTETDGTANAPPNPPAKGERIAKMLARAGIGSRRAVERMIEAGLVRQGDRLIKSPATLITSTEGITVDGQPVKEIEPPRLWRYHKPAGLITTYFDPQGRRTVFSALPPEMPRVVAVGRLDFTTEGLLLLTNDGGLARVLELPATGWLRRYRVRAFGHADLKFIDAIKGGVTIEGVNYGPIEINIEKQQGDNVWLRVGIREGKNREVRKVLEHFGLTVNRLIRVSYGPFQLGKLPRGGVEEVSSRVIKSALANYLQDSGQEILAHGDDPEQLKESKPLGRTGWAKAKPKPEKPKRKPRRPRLDAKAGEEGLAAKPAPAERPGRSTRPERPDRPVSSAKPVLRKGPRSGPRPATPRPANPDGQARPARGAKPAGRPKATENSRPQRPQRPPRPKG